MDYTHQAGLTSITPLPEARFVKHLTRITQSQPASADAMQDFVCFTAQALNSFITIIGGVLPLTTFIEEKCALPTPNDSGNGT
jgi:hypothetical protein